jgi:hypothetical protein
VPYCTLEEVKTAIVWAVGETDHDAFIAELIIDVADAIDQKLGRVLASTAYTEYLDGGRAVLPITFWPLITVTTIHGDDSHEFGSDTLIDSGDYFISDAGAGLIRHKSGAWTSGSDNLRVIYQGGYAATPGVIRRLAIQKTVREIKMRSNVDEVTSSHSDGSVTRRNLSEWDEHEENVLRPFMLV